MNKLLVLLVVVIAGGFIIMNITNNSPKQSPSGNDVPKEEMAPSATMSKNRYAPYDATLFQKQKDKRRVLFFHAKWCPTCKIADKDFVENSQKIPDDVVLFKTDYDTEKELIARYGITYQHTFVYVDSEGNELKKWNGGGIAELLSNILPL
ncbi:MAG: thioredoxin family protein [Microgenomates group bacterium]